MILEEERKKWLKAAYTYYLEPGDDTGMSDLEWDATARLLYSHKDEMPWCPVLSDPTYEGGSLFWATSVLYDKAFAAKSNI